MSTIEYGIVEAYDEATHSADVLPVADPRARWEAAPVIGSCPGEIVTVGATVAVSVWDDGRVLVLGPISRPVFPKVYGSRYDSWQTFDSEDYTERTGIAIEITLTVESYFLVWAMTTVYNNSGSARDILAYLRLYADDAAVSPRVLVGGPANVRLGQSLSVMVASAFEVGTHDVDLRCALYDDSYTCQLGWTALSVLVVPAA